jgi:hypothetical protein
MGKCPERASPSPPAVVGTFPYNLLNGTAGKRLIRYGDSIGTVPCLASSRPRSGEDVESLMARRVSVSTSLQDFRHCVGPAIRNVDPPEDGDSPRHHVE